MKLASYKTLKNSRKTRISYAYNAMERDSMACTGKEQDDATEAIERLGTMSVDEMMDWAFREVEYRQLTSDDRQC